jgi:hypothetical protein
MTNQITNTLNHFFEAISNGITQTKQQIRERLQDILGTAINDADSGDNFFSQDDLDNLLEKDAKKS